MRGLAGQYPLDDDGAKRIGMAVGTHFAQTGQRIVIGCDPRESSARLVEAVTAGLLAVGVDVVMAGVIPTAGLAYLAREGDFAAGVVVTASHNSYEYNGIKVFDANGDKLSDETESKLNALIEADVPERGAGHSSVDDNSARTYEDFLVTSAGGLQLSGIRLAVDSANGSASGFAERVFKRLSASVKPLFDNPDGKNINAGCGATNTQALSDETIADKLDLGIALDGDADRVMLVDGQGRPLNGDHLLYILAVSGKLDGVVATVMSNLGLEQAFKQHDIQFKRVKVGDRYVLEGLAETGFHLGGEQSGHIIFPDLLKTGDGLLAAVQTVRAVVESGKSLAQWRDELALLPQALVNFPLTDKALLEKPEIQAFLAQQTRQMAGTGRLLVRPSGTEPLARVMVEAPDADGVVKRIAAELQELLAKQTTGSQA